jgi:tetratricopeptide (TPR) repeat protein
MTRPAPLRPGPGRENVNTTKPWIFVGVILCGLMASRTPLHAQSADAPSAAGGENMPWNQGISGDTREAARTLFLEGNRLFKIPLFAQAVEKYGEALEKWKHPAFYFNLAIAQLNLGQDLEARENLEHALKYGPEPLRADRFQEAQKQLLEVQRHLGRLRVSCPTPGAEVTLDGVALFTGPGNQEVWVKAQAHEIAAKKPEYVTQSRHVTAAAGKLEPLTLNLHKLIQDRPWAIWKPWAVVGSGVAIAVAGGVVHALSARDFKSYDAGFVKLPCATLGCTEQAINDSDPHLSSQLSRARLEQKIAIGGYIGASAVVAAGVILVYMNQPHLMEQEGAKPPATGIAMVPVVSADMLGVLLTVSH